MGICTAEAERIHPNDQTTFGRQRCRFDRHGKTPILERNPRIDLPEMDRGRDDPVLQHEQCLHEAYDSGSCLEMAHIALY